MSSRRKETKEVDTLKRFLLPGFVFVLMASQGLGATKSKALLVEGERLHAEKKYEEAVQRFKKVLEQEPENVRALNNLAVAYIALGKYEDGEKAAESAGRYATKPTDIASAYYNVGLARERAGRLALAGSAYRVSLSYRDNPALREKVRIFCNGEDGTWMLEEKGTQANRIVIDCRWPSLRRKVVPGVEGDLLGYQTSMTEIIDQVLGGPPDPVHLEEDRFLWFSACRAHSCEEKGFFWFDLKEKRGIAVAAHYCFGGGRPAEKPSLYIVTRQYKRQEIPAEFERALGVWVKEQSLDVVQRRYYCAP
jgi:tetratricopeptide (TPR) repeat protein